MCGRYTLTTDGDTLAEAFGLEQLSSWSPRFNIAPTQDVAVILRQSAGNQAAKLSWGLVPSWAKDRKAASRLINARAETVAEKPSFRAAYKRRRCLILADGYYEWTKTADGKQPFYITSKSRDVFAFAGIWERWGEPERDLHYSCSIITCAANDDLAKLHHRMPVVIGPQVFDKWLDNDTDDDDRAQLLNPSPNGVFTAYPVSTAVNSPANDDPDCIAQL